MNSAVYFSVFAILVGSTAGELVLIGQPIPTNILASTIIGLAGVKAVLIALFFQHLKYEPKALSTLLLMALLAATAVITISLLSILK